ncbi:MAG: KH domain-containing protein, partial [Abitibacteriaceae bacterium]|nr:KH domain-containing protein [Abditibacteriaceae bacterium]
MSDELTPQGGANGDHGDEADDIMSAAMDDTRYDEPTEEDERLIELVGYLVQGIVAHPDDVEVDQFFDDVGSIYGVRVHPEDVGRVIGKEGRIA